MNMYSPVAVHMKKKMPAGNVQLKTAEVSALRSPHHDKSSNSERDLTDVSSFQRQNVGLQRDQALRLKRIDRVCRLRQIKGEVRQLYTYSPSKVSYCSNHKAASTYWIQVFRFLHNDTPPHIKRPADLPKYYTHMAPLRKTKKVDFMQKLNYEETLQNFRFMMARDPYERLWSVYIDKFILFDLYFWETADTNKGIGSNHKHKSHCKQISFEEFLIYVSTTGKTNPLVLNDHFQPIHIGCNPCRFKPNFVGHVETLNQEKNFILDKLGHTPNTNEIEDHEDHILHEITEISKFQFQQLSISSSSSKFCATMKNIQERIIVAFVLNGYLPLDLLDTFSPWLPISKDTFISKLVKVFKDSNRTAEDTRQQRETLRKEAYKKVPFQTLLSLQDIFKDDFLLFGYDPQPSY
ncbi:hypothetical protein EGW08_018768, partial [Elysia chlorotica]